MAEEVGWDSGLRPRTRRSHSSLLKNLSVFNIFLHGKKYFFPDPLLGFDSPEDSNIYEQVRGVEPLSLAWKAKVIPIYDTCILKILVGVLGFEPRLNAPKAFVLPLHNTPIYLELYLKKTSLSKGKNRANILIVKH